MDTPEAAGIAPQGSPQRRLAAVVFTDVVGYSSMVQADEAGALARVAADLARMRVLCSTHGGECLNSMGDGLMLSFASTVQALGFALEVQEEFARRNESLASGAPLRHRIGIHLGDVLGMPDGTLAGDGVNTAARLEGSAPPGGICISQTVYDTVKGKLPFEARFAGAKRFKNIGEPVPVWYLHPRGEGLQPETAPAQPSRPAVRRRTLVAAGGAAAVLAAGAAWLLRGRGGPAASAAFDAKSIAVLPFQNMSDDKDTSYFADGMHEDLLTQLAMLGQLKVVSRTSVMEYRNTAKKVPQIGSELQVASLVEGSVRRAGNLVRVTAQLVDARSDKHLWAANYDREIKDIFKVQSELATEIARSLNVSLTTAEARQLTRVPTASLEAWDLFLRHQELVRNVAGSVRARSTVRERVELLQRAVALDPAFALAWARLAGEHARAKAYGFDPQGDQKALAQRAISQALTLAPDDLQVRIEEAAVHLHALGDHAGARRAYGQVLAKAPFNVEALHGMAEVLNEMMLSKEAVAMLERALAVDARNVAVLTRLASTYGRYRHYDRSMELRERIMALRPDDMELRAIYELWRYWKTGSWAPYEAWRKTLPQGVESRAALVRNNDTEVAISRGEFDEVRRLIDVDTEDFRRALSPTAEVDAERRSLHALAWHAAGDKARAAAAASDTLRLVEQALASAGAGDRLWHTRATLHALLGQKAPALAAMRKYLEAGQTSGNQYSIELHRRELAALHAMLGEHDEALALLRQQAGHPGFFIHDLRVNLPLASLWKHPGFIALVNDPATNAPLPLDTPLSADPKR